MSPLKISFQDLGTSTTREIVIPNGKIEVIKGIIPAAFAQCSSDGRSGTFYHRSLRGGEMRVSERSPLYRTDILCMRDMLEARSPEGEERQLLVAIRLERG